MSLTLKSLNGAGLKSLSQKPIIRNAGWLMGGQGAGLFFQAVYFICLARLLGSTEYGVFAGAFAFTSIVAQYTPLGTGTVFLRYVSGQPARCAPYFGNILLTTSIMSGLLIAGLSLSARHLLNPESAHIVFIAAIGNCLFAQMTQEIGRVFQAFEKMRITAVLNFLVSALRVVAVLALLLLKHHASAFQWAVAATSVSGLAALSGIVLAIVNFGRPSFDVSVARTHMLEGFGFSFASSTSAVYNDIDKTMLSHYGMNVATGIYSMAYRLVDFATIPIFAIRDAALPGLFQRGHEGITKTSQYAHRLLVRTLSLAVLASLCLALGAPIIPKLLGAGFSESVSALRWLAIIPVFRTFHQMTGVALTSCGRQNVRTASQVTAACFNFGMNLWLIPRFGWHGAAWASVLTDGGLAIMNWLALKVLVARSTMRLAPSLT